MFLHTAIFFRMSFERRHARSCWVHKERGLEEIYLSHDLWWFFIIILHDEFKIFNIFLMHFIAFLTREFSCLQSRYNLRQYRMRGENDSSRVDRLGYIAFIIILSHRSIYLTSFSLQTCLFAFGWLPYILRTTLTWDIILYKLAFNKLLNMQRPKGISHWRIIKKKKKRNN